MALPLWGSLQKAQDDAQTIVEAVAEMIAEHESDPEAHLGEGESLQAHKSFEVIDHPAGSVLGDKMPMTEFSVMHAFESLDVFYSMEGLVTNSFNGVNVSVDNPTNHYSHAKAGSGGPGYALVPQKEWVIDIFFSIRNNSNSSNFVGFSGQYDDNVYGPGFKVVNGALYMGFGNDSGYEYSDAISWSYTGPKSIRVQNVPSQEKLLYFLNGVQVWEYEYDEETQFEFLSPAFWSVRTGTMSGGFGGMIISLLRFSAQM